MKTLGASLEFLKPVHVTRYLMDQARPNGLADGITDAVIYK
jgi:hypothetical protein